MSAVPHYYEEYEDSQQSWHSPVSFEVATKVPQMPAIALPLEPRRGNAQIVHRPVMQPTHQPAYQPSGRSQPVLQPQLRSTASALPAVVAAPPQPAPRPKVRPLVRPSVRTARARKLRLAQRASMLVASVLSVTTLSIYGWTVHIQQRGGELYSRWDSLQTQENGLKRTTESLGSQLVETAEQPGSVMRLPGPEAVIYLVPEALRPAVQPPVADDETEQRPVRSGPQGY